MSTKILKMMLVLVLTCFSASVYAQFDPMDPGDPGFPGDPGDPGDTPPGMLGVSVIGPNGFSDMDMTLFWDLDYGSSINFDSIVSGQTGSLSYNWLVNDSSYSSGSSMQLDASNAAGTSVSVNLIVEDWLGGSMVSSGGAAFFVDIAAQPLDDLSLLACVNGVDGGAGVVIDPTLGEGLVLAAMASGGDGLYSFGWNFDGGAIDETLQCPTLSAEDIISYMNFASAAELADAVAAASGVLDFNFDVTVSDGSGTQPVTGPLSVVVVPEPTTAALLALGGLILIRRKIA